MGYPKYADIIIDIAVQQLDRTFQYRIPEQLYGRIAPGSMVEIPFGNGDKSRKGYVISFSDQPAIEESKIKPILGLITDSQLVESNLVRLAAFISKNYGSTFAAALKTVFPLRKKMKEKEAKYLHLRGDHILWQEKLAFYEKKHQVARLRLLSELLLEKEIPLELAVSKLNVSRMVIKALVDQGLCEIDAKRIYRNPMESGQGNKHGHKLNSQQRYAVESIVAEYDILRRGENANDVALIRGITGSGKTEVYIDIVEQVIKRGQQAIVLIPEIALTYQTVMRFYKRFGDRVSTLHSRLSEGQRYDQFERAKRGELDVVIGPRSALFTPFSSLGIIIIDEEHEGSYKSEQTPKYHARETAIYRARLQNAMVVLGSATPSVDSYFRAKNGDYKLYELTERATSGVLPKVSIVDLRQELLKGNKSAFSDELTAAINDRLEKKEQIMLFLNRRGYAGFISCRSCGYVFSCPHCDVSLSGHRSGQLVCHYCGYERPYKKECPECGSKYVGVMKAGTQAIELLASKCFPKARILRMDMDTTKGKDGHEKILSAFADGDADILIGTQMIVKGHDFPNVTLVGILAADMSLHVSDYRAGERTFQLLTQAAGRAGRGDKKGEVIIQTYSPDNPYIVAGAAQNYEKFYEQEITYRELLSYPPTAHMLAVLLEDKDLARLKTAAKHMADVAKNTALREFEESKNMVNVIGPAPASIQFINDVHRQVIYLKGKDYTSLVKIKDEMEIVFSQMMNGQTATSMQFDFNPMSGY